MGSSDSSRGKKVAPAVQPQSGSLDSEFPVYSGPEIDKGPEVQKGVRVTGYSFWPAANHYRLGVSLSNQGDKPISKVFANITLFDMSGSPYGESPQEVCIFTTEDNEGKPLKPDDHYGSTPEFGYELKDSSISPRTVADIKFEITRVSYK